LKKYIKMSLIDDYNIYWFENLMNKFDAGDAEDF
jgi:hypothetical protein